MGILFVWADEDGTEQRDAYVLPATVGATISQMELEAPSEALRIAMRGRTPFDLAQFEKIVILSDSRYVCDNLRYAQFVWPKTGWRTKDGPAVLNERDWKTLTKSMERMYRERHIRVGIEWERGKVSANAKAVDKLAKQSSASESFGRARPTNVRRKLTSASVERGSVRVQGQQLRVRIIEARHLSGREGLYRYEVLDPSSAYDTKVDLAESDQPLGPGHTYDVTMNPDQANPRIVAIVGEVEEDLTPFRDALRTLARPASATDVATEITRATGAALTPPVAKRRLDFLVTQGEARVALATTGRRRFLYELLPVDVPDSLKRPRPAAPGERPGTEGDTLLYFGYGSNLSTARLADPERAPSAVKVGRAQLPGHRLKFHKRSSDGSSKADARGTGVPTDLVEGVVFRISEADRPCLDYAEGAGFGYFTTEVTVTMLSNTTPQKAVAYVAADDAIWDRPPFDWYVGYALAGAQEHDLPQEYIQKYITVQTMPDPRGGEKVRACPHRKTTRTKSQSVG